MKKIKQFFKAVLIVYREGVGAVFSDPLTGLYSRQFLEEIGPKEIARAKRYRRPLSLVFFGSDNLESINNIYGYQQGDKILQKVARLLRNHCRKADTMVRWGGDKFLLILPETTDVEAEYLIGRVTRELGNEDIRLSYGIVPWNSEEYSSLKEFIKEGDRRLYQHKQEKGLKPRA